MATKQLAMDDRQEWKCRCPKASLSFPLDVAFAIDCNSESATTFNSQEMSQILKFSPWSPQNAHLGLTGRPYGFPTSNNIDNPQNTQVVIAKLLPQMKELFSPSGASKRGATLTQGSPATLRSFTSISIQSSNGQGSEPIKNRSPPKKDMGSRSVGRRGRGGGTESFKRWSGVDPSTIQTSAIDCRFSFKVCLRRSPSSVAWLQSSGCSLFFETASSIAFY
ncbi:hypothetical protein SISNIDRAFT_461770 [Sistotremastrum niveocremeum HHB9708]|uniref:Uncharacterized protein n=1 Tax=Sistotremastrum niveocremeum HHB9708 TaxID=1314777 RepID=A0A165ACP4_9AGAM|nr:hypothetical protein SISNIDRAFT_461770 [Sistotremastrum niveocremeum HHB9708]